MLSNTNFSELTLLRNTEMYWVSDDGNIIKVKIPTIGQLADDGDLNVILRYILAEDFIKENEDMYAAIIRTCNSHSLIKQAIIENINKVLDDFQIVNNYIYCGGIRLKLIDLKFITHVLKVGLGMREFAPWPPPAHKTKQKTEIDDKFDKLKARMRAADERIRRIKNKNRDQSLLSDIFTSVGYEFKLSLDSIFEMNYYSLMMYYKQVGKIDIYRLNSIAMANGNLKKNAKHKYFTKL